MLLQQLTIWEDSGGDGENSALCRMERILQLLLDRFDANIKMHSHYQRHQKKGEVRGRMITSLCGAKQWTQQGASCQSRLFAMHSGQFIICSLDLMQICKMKSSYDDVEHLIEMQKAHALYLKNGITQPHTYTYPCILNMDIRDLSKFPTDNVKKDKHIHTHTHRKTRTNCL